MTTLTNSFEGGTSGVTITTSNSGGASGNAFDTVNTGSSATITFSSTEAAHGILSGRFTQPGTAVSCYVTWGTSLTSSSVATVYYRAYVYLPTLPPATNTRFITLVNGTSVCGAIAINTAAKVVVQAGTTDIVQYTSTNSVNTTAWFRLEGFVTGSASAGQISMSLYNIPDSVTATETFTSAGTVNTTAAISGVRYGINTQSPSYTWYMDDLGVSTTGPLGPVKAKLGGAGAAILPVLIAADLI